MLRARIDPSDPPVHCTLAIVCGGAVLTPSTWTWSRQHDGQEWCNACCIERRKQFEAEYAARPRYRPVEPS